MKNWTLDLMSDIVGIYAPLLGLLIIAIVTPVSVAIRGVIWLLERLQDALQWAYNLGGRWTVK